MLPKRRYGFSWWCVFLGSDTIFHTLCEYLILAFHRSRCRVEVEVRLQDLGRKTDKGWIRHFAHIFKVYSHKSLFSNISFILLVFKMWLNISMWRRTTLEKVDKVWLATPLLIRVWGEEGDLVLNFVFILLKGALARRRVQRKEPKSSKSWAVRALQAPWARRMGGEGGQERLGGDPGSEVETMWTMWKLERRRRRKKRFQMGNMKRTIIMLGALMTFH